MSPTGCDSSTATRHLNGPTAVVTSPCRNGSRACGSCRASDWSLSIANNADCGIRKRTGTGCRWNRSAMAWLCPACISAAGRERCAGMRRHVSALANRRHTKLRESMRSGAIWDSRFGIPAGSNFLISTFAGYVPCAHGRNSRCHHERGEGPAVLPAESTHASLRFAAASVQ